MLRGMRGPSSSWNMFSGVRSSPKMKRAVFSVVFLCCLHRDLPHESTNGLGDVP
jgi:hypothetical protein